MGLDYRIQASSDFVSVIDIQLFSSAFSSLSHKDQSSIVCGKMLKEHLESHQEFIIEGKKYLFSYDYNGNERLFKYLKIVDKSISIFLYNKKVGLSFPNYFCLEAKNAKQGFSSISQKIPLFKKVYEQIWPHGTSYENLKFYMDKCRHFIREHGLQGVEHYLSKILMICRRQEVIAFQSFSSKEEIERVGKAMLAQLRGKKELNDLDRLALIEGKLIEIVFLKFVHDYNTIPKFREEFGSPTVSHTTPFLQFTFHLFLSILTYYRSRR